MSWPDLTADRYPGVVRRELVVESHVVGDRLIFVSSLRDRWYDPASEDSEEIHGYQVRLEAAPPDLTIVSAWAEPGYLPFPECPSAVASVQRLVGLSLMNGFNKAAASALRGEHGCTHLLTMVHAISGQRVVANYMRSRIDPETSPESRARREAMVGVCAGWREGGVAIELTRKGQALGRSKFRGADGVTSEGDGH